MKRWFIKAAAAAAVTSAMLGAAGMTVQAEENSPLAIELGYDYLYGYDYDYGKALCTASYPYIYVCEENRKEYPKLQTALEMLSWKMDSEFTEKYDLEMDDARQNPDMGLPHTIDSKLYIQRADRRALSFLQISDYYLGGAHGSNVFICRNYDPETGKLLALSDVVSDTGAFFDVMKSMLVEKYPTLEWDSNSMLSDPDQLHWTIGYNGITVYFADYEAASYAAGNQVGLVPFAGNEALFKEEFLDVPENYGIQIPPIMDFPFDVDFDGSAENLNFYACKEQYEYVSLNVSIDDAEYEYEDWFFNYTPNLAVHDGKSTLVTQIGAEDDYRYLVLVDATGGSPVFLGTEPYSLTSRIVDLGGDEFEYPNRVLTDPKRVMLSRRIDVLGTTSGSSPFTMTKGGMMEKSEYEDWFVIDSERFLTLKQNLEFSIYDEAGNDLGRETVSAGTEVLYARSNGEDYADVKLPDGRYARVQLDGTGWPKTVGGVDTTDLIDGIRYAG